MLFDAFHKRTGGVLARDIGKTLSRCGSIEDPLPPDVSVEAVRIGSDEFTGGLFPFAADECVFMTIEGNTSRRNPACAGMTDNELFRVSLRHDTGYWQIKGYDGTHQIFDREIRASHFSENQIACLLKALVAKTDLEFDVFRCQVGNARRLLTTA